MFGKPPRANYPRVKYYFLVYNTIDKHSNGWYNERMDKNATLIIERVFALCGESAVKILDYQDIASMPDLRARLEDLASAGYLVLKYADDESVCVGLSPSGVRVITELRLARQQQEEERREKERQENARREALAKAQQEELMRRQEAEKQAQEALSRSKRPAGRKPKRASAIASTDISHVVAAPQSIDAVPQPIDAEPLSAPCVDIVAPQSDPVPLHETPAISRRSAIIVALFSFLGGVMGGALVTVVVWLITHLS